MKKIYLILLFFPLFIFSQNNEVYISLINAGGKQIKGESVTRGYENWILASSLNSGGKNNTQVSFTMNITGASAELKKAVANGELFQSAQVSAIQAGNFYSMLLYTIKMEKIKVVSCTESLGCNGVMTTTVSLQPTRIGWTYYQTSKMGIQTVTNKFGINTETGSEWINF